MSDGNCPSTFAKRFDGRSNDLQQPPRLRETLQRAKQRFPTTFLPSRNASAGKATISNNFPAFAKCFGGQSNDFQLFPTISNYLQRSPLQLLSENQDPIALQAQVAIFVAKAGGLSFPVEGL